jgi:hypothetical protein
MIPFTFTYISQSFSEIYKMLYEARFIYQFELQCHGFYLRTFPQSTANPVLVEGLNLYNVELKTN